MMMVNSDGVMMVDNVGGLMTTTIICVDCFKLTTCTGVNDVG